jgi:EmrB/QacA subfamily drug resistance transporter
VQVLRRRKIPPYLALIPVCAGVFVAADDQTVVVTVLPEIIRDMRLGPYELDRAAWTITGYLLGYVAAMPLIGRLSDIWGHRRLFILSMLLFMVGSAAVALTTSLEWLIAARIFQAVGAGALVPISIAIVGDIFPKHRRGVPVGIVGASAEAGGVVGPLWGGIIIRYVDWEWVFWVNIPLGALVLVALVLLLGPSPRHQAKVDCLGGALIAASLASMTFGLSRIDSRDLLMVGYFAASSLSFALFVVRQRAVEDPILPLSMFKSWALRGSSAAHLLIGGSLIIGMVTVPLMANTVMGRTPLEGGLMLMRLTIAIPFGAVLGGIASQRLDYRVPTVLGLVLVALGFLLMSGWDADTADAALTLHLLTAGLGFGLLIAPIALAATNSVEVTDRGAAAALVTATRMIGMTLGLAALTAWGAGRFDRLVAGIEIPFALPGETAEQIQQRSVQFEAQVSNAGYTLFNEFFLVAMGLALLALVPTILMAWHPGRTGPEPPSTDSTL